jgi:hypothetical protein
MPMGYDPWVMWPFRKPQRPVPWIEEALQRSHSVILELDRRLSSLEHALSVQAGDVATAKAVERRIGGLEVGLRQLAASLEDHVARLTTRVEVVNGYATGRTGGRPRNEEREADRQALELGRRVAAALATPEGVAQLVQELTQTNGTPPSKWAPAANGHVSPV